MSKNENLEDATDQDRNSTVLPVEEHSQKLISPGYLETRNETWEPRETLLKWTSTTT